jgi:hypothetical protein
MSFSIHSHRCALKILMGIHACPRVRIQYFELGPRDLPQSVYIGLHWFSLKTLSSGVPKVGLVIIIMFSTAYVVSPLLLSLLDYSLIAGLKEQCLASRWSREDTISSWWHRQPTETPTSLVLRLPVSRVHSRQTAFSQRGWSLSLLYQMSINYYILVVFP